MATEKSSDLHLRNTFSAAAEHSPSVSAPQTTSSTPNGSPGLTFTANPWTSLALSAHNLKSTSSFDQLLIESTRGRTTQLKECTHVFILLILLVCYILMGGCVFQQLEGNLALQRLRNFSQLSHRRHIRYYHAVRGLFRDEHCSALFASAAAPLSTPDSQKRFLECNTQIRRLLESYDDEVFRLMDLPARVLRQDGDSAIDGVQEDLLGRSVEEAKALSAIRLQSDWSWNYWNSAFFALSVVSTIGYGNMNCETTSGRLFTIIYALIGIPFTLTTLNKLGDVLFHRISTLYQSTRIRLTTSFWISKRKFVEESQLKSQIDVHHPIFHESYSLWLALVIVFIYITVCAYFLALLEDEWSWFTSFYFLFISLSTIGLGDEMPQYHHYYTIYSFMLLLVGLALMSTFVAVMKARFEDLYAAAVKFLDGDRSPMADLVAPCQSGSDKV